MSSHSGFLRSDKPIGTALLKLDKLETQSEIREIVEVSDKSQEGVLQVSLDPQSATCEPVNVRNFNPRIR